MPEKHGGLPAGARMCTRHLAERRVGPGDFCEQGGIHPLLLGAGTLSARGIEPAFEGGRQTLSGRQSCDRSRCDINTIQGRNVRSRGPQRSKRWSRFFPGGEREVLAGNSGHLASALGGRIFLQLFPNQGKFPFGTCQSSFF